MRETKVILCSTCEGYGKLFLHETTDYHRGEYDVIVKECRSCDGKGRLLKKTTLEFEKLND